MPQKKTNIMIEQGHKGRSNSYNHHRNCSWYYYYCCSCCWYIFSFWLAPVAVFMIFALSCMWVFWHGGILTLFKEAYAAHVLHLEDNAWLIQQCADPQFVSRMMRQKNTDICKDARALSLFRWRMPAFLVGLQACISLVTVGSPSVGALAVILFCMILWLSLFVYFISTCRERANRADATRMLARCSPDLPVSWRYQRQQQQQTLRHRNLAALQSYNYHARVDIDADADADADANADYM